jgi:TadE-like protein
MSGPAGGAGAAGAPRTIARRSPDSGDRTERGSQTLEFAMVVPAVVLLCVLLLNAALFGSELVLVQGLAREAARTAALEDDAAVEAGLRAAVDGRPVQLSVTPPSGRRVPGQLVTVRLRLRSRAFAALGREIWVPAAATMRVERA